MGLLRRIDYVLFSRGLVKRASYASNELDLGSDHRAVRAEFEFQRPAESFKAKRKSMKGWMPRFDEDGTPSECHAKCNELLSAEDEISLQSISVCARHAASTTGSSDSGPQGARRPDQSAALKDLIYQRRLTNSVDERKNISEAILKLSRQELRASTDKDEKYKISPKSPHRASPFDSLSDRSG